MAENVKLDNGSQFEIFPDCLKLRRIDPAKNMCRFYLMTVQRDLFGGVSLIREWGRLGSGGCVQREHYSDEGKAVDALALIAQQKFKRGHRCNELHLKSV
jgi:predicted DNA-binding WGR domain protein